MAGIVVGVDGSAHSHIALEWALTEAGLRHAPLTVVAVSPVAVGNWGIAALHYAGDEAGRGEVERMARELVDKALAERQGAPAAQVAVRAVSGLPADELVKASADADLLVVGARGAGGFARLMMGSVSSQVVHYAHCPVVVVRGEGAR